MKILCFLYDSYLLCSCQSSEKKIEKKDNPRFLSDLSGERYDL